jgi:hypothetical protein
LLAKADRALGANFFAPAAIRAPAPEELQQPHVLFHVRHHNHAGRANVGAAAASEAEIAIESDFAAESGFGVMRRKRVSQGHAPGFQANQGFSQFAQEHLNLLPVFGRRGGFTPPLSRWRGKPAATFPRPNAVRPYLPITAKARAASDETPTRMKYPMA